MRVDRGVSTRLGDFNDFNDYGFNTYRYNYTTGAGACYWAQLEKITFGASDKKRGFSINNTNILHPKTKCNHGTLASESSKLLTDFFENLRE